MPPIPTPTWALLEIAPTEPAETAPPEALTSGPLEPLSFSTTGGSIVQVQHLETLSTEAIDALLAEFLPEGNRIPSLYAVDTYRVRFQTHDEMGQLIETRADLRFPRADTITQFPILVYGSGTTGIGNSCATLDEQSQDRNWGNYRSHMLSYATQGFIAVIANWQRFDDSSRVHPYFVAELEGRVMLDAARAAYKFFDNPVVAERILARPSDAVFLGGYSQGGHGAFSADYVALTYAPELPIRGIIGHAMSPDVEGLMIDSPRYSPYIVYAFRDFYGTAVIDPVDVFIPYWLSTFEADVLSKCIDEAYAYYSDRPAEMYTPAFLDALYNDRLGEVAPLFNGWLDHNNNDRRINPAVPGLVLHGEDDRIVKPPTNRRFVAQMCDKGKNITYILYSEANHFTTRQHSFVDTLRWMQSIMADNIPESGCPEFLEYYSY